MKGTATFSSSLFFWISQPFFFFFVNGIFFPSTDGGKESSLTSMKLLAGMEINTLKNLISNMYINNIIKMSTGGKMCLGNIFVH